MNHRPARISALTIALVSLSLSTVARAQFEVVDPSWPDWLIEAMAQEDENQSFSPVTMGIMQTRVPGEVSEKTDLGDGVWYVASRDERNIVFECWFYPDAIDLAGSIAGIAEVIIENTSEQQGAVNLRQINFVSAGAIGDAPYLALEWLYTVGDPGKASVVYSKLRAAEKDGASVICAHSMAGYRASFAAGFEAVVSNLDIDRPSTEPYFHEIHALSLNGLMLGYAEVIMTLDDEGDTRIDSTEAMLIPISSEDLGTSDGSTVSWSTPEGYLINTLTGTSENGELTTEMALEYVQDEGWVASGMFSGKEINANLGDEADPLSVLGEMQAVSSLVTDPDAEAVDLQVWIADANPTAFIPVSLTRSESSDAAGSITMSMGPIQVDGDFDENGSLVSGSMDMAGTEMNFERVHVSGGLR